MEYNGTEGRIGVNTVHICDIKNIEQEAEKEFKASEWRRALISGYDVRRALMKLQ